ncbi:hypothetical protein DFH05DRAFT_1618731 [Lentinula detonsa]|uniref:DUF6532 domain-containing protein n=1 Tax=Lentinula detonsa TaxID=2804962 RepID=A0A9W8NYP1_9AGAR|nr:hypothetical protein DFH05DRAFT_1618731 [Lentinula detonsa]
MIVGTAGVELGMVVTESDDEVDNDEMPAHCRKLRGFSLLDMTTSQREINEYAVGYFCGLLSVGNILSDKGEAGDIVVQAWFQALRYLTPLRNFDGFTEPTEVELDILSQWGATLCGRFKASAKRNITVFDLKKSHKGIPGGVTALIIINRDRVEKLKDRKSYVFRILEDIVEAMYNNGRKSIGVHCVQIFGDMMPLPVIALAATAIEAALDEYKDGQFAKKKFSTSLYCPVFEHHMKQLENWKSADQSHQTDTLGCFRQSMMIAARSAAKINDEPTAAQAQECENFTLPELC